MNTLKKFRNAALIGIFFAGQAAALYVFAPGGGWFQEHQREARVRGYYDGFDDGVQGAADRISIYRALFKGDYEEGYTRGLRAGGGYRRT